MGRIKTSFVKSIAKELYSKHSEKFTTNFSENKKIVKQLIDLKSKKLMNVIAGYITSLKQREKAS